MLLEAEFVGVVPSSSPVDVFLIRSFINTSFLTLVRHTWTVYIALDTWVILAKAHGSLTELVSH